MVITVYYNYNFVCPLLQNACYTFYIAINNEELSRHYVIIYKIDYYRGREGKMECSLCRDECENVNHVLWKCSA